MLGRQRLAAGSLKSGKQGPFVAKALSVSSVQCPGLCTLLPCGSALSHRPGRPWPQHSRCSKPALAPVSAMLAASLHCLALLVHHVPQGWDKTYCLRFVKDDFDEIHFFGDKTFEVRLRVLLPAGPSAVGLLAAGLPAAGAVSGFVWGRRRSRYRPGASIA